MPQMTSLNNQTLRCIDCVNLNLSIIACGVDGSIFALAIGYAIEK